MSYRLHVLATGTNGGLTLATIGEFCANVNWQNFLTVVFAAASTGLSYYVSARSAKREQDRLDREIARQERLEDVLQELRLRKCGMDTASPSAPCQAGTGSGGGTTVGVVGSS